MTKIFNLIILIFIIFLLINSIRRKEKILDVLFLVGLTQIGSFYPILGKIRLELIIGIFSLILIFSSSTSVKRIFFTSSDPVFKSFYFFIIVVLLSVPFSVSPSDALYWLGYYFKRCFIYFFLIIAFLDNENKVHNFIWIILIGILWLGLHAVFGFILGINVVIDTGVERERGVTGLLSNPNGLANTIVQTIPFIYYLFLHEKNKIKKYILIIMGIVSFIAVIVSGSRGGFLGLFVTLFLFGFFAKRKKLSLSFSLATILAILFTVSIMDPSLIGRYSTILSFGTSDPSASSRWDGLIHGISMFIKRPILGVGIGVYPIARKLWFNWGLWSHQTYGQLIGELGIMGLLSWPLLVYYTVKGAKDIRNILSNYIIYENQGFFYYMTYAIEISTYVRLILGMTTHSLHIYFWYINAAIIVIIKMIIYSDYLNYFSKINKTK